MYRKYLYPGNANYQKSHQNTEAVLGNIQNALQVSRRPLLVRHCYPVVSTKYTIETTLGANYLLSRLH